MNKRERLIDAYEYLRSTGVIHTKKDFAQKINFGVTNLSAAFGGNESYLTKGLFDKIAIAFPNVFNEEWLHEGKKPMLKNIHQTANGDGNMQVAGNGNTVTHTDTALTKALDEIAEQRKLVAKAQEQTSKAQEQIDRLIGLLEKK